VLSEKESDMFVVLFPSGRTLSFSVKALAETYVMAYNGVLINDPQESKVIPAEVLL
jgi:hypothetical protein